MRRPGGFHSLLRTELGALLTWHFLRFAVLADRSTYLFSPLCEMEVLFISHEILIVEVKRCVSFYLYM